MREVLLISKNYSEKKNVDGILKMVETKSFFKLTNDDKELNEICNKLLVYGILNRDTTKIHTSDGVRIKHVYTDGDNFRKAMIMGVDKFIKQEQKNLNPSGFIHWLESHPVISNFISTTIGILLGALLTYLLT
ncbi:hypothetical protein [Zunongwangia atlantica]|uniref:Uncharacterized protein n=1 Tax=Zunongwangia atlantica 22II14-10F7 TaxID=1185767 RepID=A0A1Y1T2W6_9FLAO|nr:hypothetical protein [Zunongwangia atlantica]ORL45379.1 hypothetical protein IIF7_11173 [Zunongwangia atlantica 22II14-10F7]